MADFILAIDQGTTSCRSIIFNKTGAIVSSAQKEISQIFPHPGWVEHDPEEILASQVSVVHESLLKARLSYKDILTIGITNQRETTIIWEKSSGKPIYNGIVWQDHRTVAIVEKVRSAGHEAFISESTGLELDPYFSATKIVWLLDNIPDAHKRAVSGDLLFGTIDSWLVYHLTEGTLHITDATNASRTLLYNIHTCQWDDRLLSVFDIPKNILPEIRDSSDNYGDAVTLFDGPIPISSIIGDQQASGIGQAITGKGYAKNTYGTGCFLMANSQTEIISSQNRLLTTVASRLSSECEYALEGSVFIGGAVVQWLRDGLGLISSASEIEPIASSVADSNGVFFVPAFAGLGAPYWDQKAQGLISGLTRGTRAAHIARAALEAIAFQVADVVNAMINDFGEPFHELRVDGGAASNNLLLQFQADLLGIPVVRSKNIETTAWGAAFLAGLAVGVWNHVNDAGNLWKADCVFQPNISTNKRQELMDGWVDAVNRTRSIN